MKEDKHYSHIKRSKNLAKYDPAAYDMSSVIGSPRENPIWEDDLFFGPFSCTYISFYFPLEPKISSDYLISDGDIKIFDKIIIRIIKIGLFE